MKKRIPKFNSKESAALFWEKNDVFDYIDPDEFKVIKPSQDGQLAFQNPNRKPKKQLISIRVNTALIEKAKLNALKKHVGYQAILHEWLKKGAQNKLTKTQ